MVTLALAAVLVSGSNVANVNVEVGASVKVKCPPVSVVAVCVKPADCIVTVKLMAALPSVRVTVPVTAPVAGITMLAKLVELAETFVEVLPVKPVPWGFVTDAITVYCPGATA